MEAVFAIGMVDLKLVFASLDGFDHPALLAVSKRESEGGPATRAGEGVIAVRAVVSIHKPSAFFAFFSHDGVGAPPVPVVRSVILIVKGAGIAQIKSAGVEPEGNAGVVVPIAGAVDEPDFQKDFAVQAVFALAAKHHQHRQKQQHTYQNSSHDHYLHDPRFALPWSTRDLGQQSPPAAVNQSELG